MPDLCLIIHATRYKKLGQEQSLSTVQQVLHVLSVVFRGFTLSTRDDSKLKIIGKTLKVRFLSLVLFPC